MYTNYMSFIVATRSCLFVGSKRKLPIKLIICTDYHNRNPIFVSVAKLAFALLGCSCAFRAVLNINNWLSPLLMGELTVKKYAWFCYTWWAQNNKPLIDRTPGLKNKRNRKRYTSYNRKIKMLRTL